MINLNIFFLDFTSGNMHSWCFGAPKFKINNVFVMTQNFNQKTSEVKKKRACYYWINIILDIGLLSNLDAFLLLP